MYIACFRHIECHTMFINIHDACELSAMEWEKKHFEIENDIFDLTMFILRNFVPNNIKKVMHLYILYIPKGSLIKLLFQLTDYVQFPTATNEQYKWVKNLSCIIIILLRAWFVEIWCLDNHPRYFPEKFRNIMMHSELNINNINNQTNIKTNVQAIITLHTKVWWNNLTVPAS